jgi:L-serine dehydratase
MRRTRLRAYRRRVISVFDLFSIGIGPSSSHTVGPMRAANRFVALLDERGALTRVAGVRVELYGSLGATGIGHGTPDAVVLGLEGHRPETVDPEHAVVRRQEIRADGKVLLAGSHPVALDDNAVALLPRVVDPRHTNALKFTAVDTGGVVVAEKTYYSIGGGFVLADDEDEAANEAGPEHAPPYPFETAAELLDRCATTGATIAELMLANETVVRDEAEVRARLVEIWRVMRECIDAGCRTGGTLPGALRVRRRAAGIYERLRAPGDPAQAMDWLNLAAMAINEQNASGGRIVTAPTNGAAGIVPAVLFYALHFLPDRPSEEDVVVDYLLTAAAVAILFKRRASISGAEVGCQGEVGSACSMAAAGLTALLGGTAAQIENAAEIAIEHNLGLTCDPVGGLVQIPCIERNAVGAVKAVNAATLAMHGDGKHHVSLDQAIETMRQTGRDMLDKYKETSTGGLAVNVVEC